MFNHNNIGNLSIAYIQLWNQSGVGREGGGSVLQVLRDYTRKLLIALEFTTASVCLPRTEVSKLP